MSDICILAGFSIQITEPSSADDLLDRALEVAGRKQRVLFFCTCQWPMCDGQIETPWPNWYCKQRKGVANRWRSWCGREGKRNRPTSINDGKGDALLKIQGIIETAIYVDDLELTETFYRAILGLTMIAKEPGRHVFFQVGASDVLLAFIAAATLKGDQRTPHGAKGPGHFALASKPTHWTLGGKNCKKTASLSKMRSSGRGAESRSTSVLRQGIRSN